MTDDEDDDFADHDVISEIPEAAARLQQLKAEKDEVEKEILFVENWIDNHVKESETVPIGEKQFKVTPVRGKTTTVNQPLLERLAPDVHKRVVTTVEKVDNDLLAKEIEKGNVPVDILRQVISQKPKKTSIRLTEWTPREEEEEDDDS